MKWARLLPLRQTWAFVAGKFLTDPVWWFYLFWVPDFLQNQARIIAEGHWAADCGDLPDFRRRQRGRRLDFVVSYPAREND